MLNFHPMELTSVKIILIEQKFSVFNGIITISYDLKVPPLPYGIHSIHLVSTVNNILLMMCILEEASQFDDVAKHFTLVP